VRFGRDALIQTEDSTSIMTTNRSWTPGPDSYELFVDAMESKSTPEQPTASLHLCAYCNNPVPNGKFVHQACEDRHDEREEQADRECVYSAE